jgi:hypothetical protein
MEKILIDDLKKFNEASHLTVCGILIFAGNDVLLESKNGKESIKLLPTDKIEAFLYGNVPARVGGEVLFKEDAIVQGIYNVDHIKVESLTILSENKTLSLPL